jgi:isopentenyl diphosphate isomerase/L-lactate dehydrogenase-like FMN-dependent dehydrogenase
MLERFGLDRGSVQLTLGRRRGLDTAASLADIGVIARRVAPRLIIDFIEGGAEDELTVTANRAAFDSWDLMPRTLVGVEQVSTAVRVIGQEISLPVILGPAGLARLAHVDGEAAAARAAKAAGTIFTLSTGSSMSIEEVCGAAPGSVWFQLYLWRDHDLVKQLLRRAGAAGCPVLVLTVDVPQMGQRERDLRNGMAIPPSFDLRSGYDVIRHARWLWRLSRQPPVTFANLSDVPGRSDSAKDLARYTNTSLVNPGADWETLSWVRGLWDGPLAVKGVLHPSDALEAVRRGADAIVVSNHGGRQLDGAVASLHALPAVLDAVGDRADVLVDGGVRRGTEVIKAVSLGAKAVMIARPWMLGLAAGGQSGVSATLRILAGELQRNLALMGCPDVGELTRHHLIARSGCSGPADRFRRP